MTGRLACARPRDVFGEDSARKNASVRCAMVASARVNAISLKSCKWICGLKLTCEQLAGPLVNVRSRRQIRRIALAPGRDTLGDDGCGFRRSERVLVVSLRNRIARRLDGGAAMRCDRKITQSVGWQISRAVGTLSDRADAVWQSSGRYEPTWVVGSYSPNAEIQRHRFMAFRDFKARNTQGDSRAALRSAASSRLPDTQRAK